MITHHYMAKHPQKFSTKAFIRLRDFVDFCNYIFSDSYAATNVDKRGRKVCRQKDVKVRFQIENLSNQICMRELFIYA